MEIISYDDEFVRIHEEFAKKVWPRKRRRSSEEYNRWKFRGPGSGRVDGLLLAVSEGKVIGQLGLIPVILSYAEKEYNAQWACDLIVDPEFRKSGTGNRLFETAMKRDVITLGNNPSPKAEILMMKAGFKTIESGRLMVFPLNPEKLVSWAVPQNFSFIRPTLAVIIKPYFDIKRKRLMRYKSDFKICSKEEISGLILKRQQLNKSPQIRHDNDFLDWRASGLKNYTPVIKSAMSAKDSYVLYSHFKPYFNIYEWNCTDESEIENMLSFLFTESSKEETEIIQAVANSETEIKMLSKCGFIKSRSKEKVIYYSRENIFKPNDLFYFTLYDTDLNL